MTFIFLDVETTGIDPNLNRIIEIACVKWENGKIKDKYESLVNPHTPIPNEITLLTGISDKDVAQAPAFSEIKTAIAEFAGDLPIVGHNIAFDLAFLKSHHLELHNAQIDTVALARILLRKESSYALEVLMKKYGLPLRGSHRAMPDVETTVDFFVFLAQKIAELTKEARGAIEPILEKTKWPGTILFNQAIPCCGTKQ